MTCSSNIVCALKVLNVFKLSSDVFGPQSSIL